MTKNKQFIFYKKYKEKISKEKKWKNISKTKTKNKKNLGKKKM